jgi:Na+/H+-translocating membrane pyrophosphatase
LAAFRGGQVLGFVLVGLALLVLEIIVVAYKAAWFDGALAELGANPSDEAVKDLVRRLFELVAGYGLGGSSVALFGRVGGGIYTKAADVGADLVGKTLKDLREDDPEIQEPLLITSETTLEILLVWVPTCSDPSLSQPVPHSSFPQPPSS